MNEMRPWTHAKSGDIHYIEFDNIEIYYRKEGEVVTELCLGERYAHSSPGLLFEHEYYHGSDINDWHGGPQGSLTDLIRWVSDAEHREFRYKLWMTGRVRLDR